MVSDNATHIATQWYSSAGPLGKQAAVFTLLIDEKMIASRVAETLGKHKGTISKQIKKLIDAQYIKVAENFLDHQKQMKQVLDGSRSISFKPYVEGPRVAVIRSKILELHNRMGVNEPEAPVWTIPGLIEPMIDVHRIDMNLPLDRNAPRGGKPSDRSLESWATLGVVPHGKVVNGWINFSAPDIDTEVGAWRVRFKRKCHYEGEEVVYDDWCDGNVARITLPNRLIISVEEALDSEKINQRLESSLWFVIAEIGKLYGFALGFPTPRTGQKWEFGTLRHDPELAKHIKERRKTEPRMLEMSEDVTADGSHDLFDEGFVHLDSEDSKKIAMQAHPVKTLSHLLDQVTVVAENFTKMTDDSIVSIEEHAVKVTDSVSDELERRLGTIVAQLEGSIEQTLDNMNQQFDTWLTDFSERTEARVNRSIERFEAELRNRRPQAEEGQMFLFDFFDDDTPNEP